MAEMWFSAMLIILNEQLLGNLFLILLTLQICVKGILDKASLIQSATISWYFSLHKCISLIYIKPQQNTTLSCPQARTVHTQNFLLEGGGWQLTLWLCVIYKVWFSNLCYKNDVINVTLQHNIVGKCIYIHTNIITCLVTYFKLKGLIFLLSKFILYFLSFLF